MELVALASSLRANRHRNVNNSRKQSAFANGRILRAYSPTLNAIFYTYCVVASFVCDFSVLFSYSRVRVRFAETPTSQQVSPQINTHTNTHHTDHIVHTFCCGVVFFYRGFARASFFSHFDRTIFSLQKTQKTTPKQIEQYNYKIPFFTGACVFCWVL